MGIYTGADARVGLFGAYDLYGERLYRQKEKRYVFYYLDARRGVEYPAQLYSDTRIRRAGRGGRDGDKLYDGICGAHDKRSEVYKVSDRIAVSCLRYSVAFGRVRRDDFRRKLLDGSMVSDQGRLFCRGICDKRRDALAVRGRNA